MWRLGRERGRSGSTSGGLGGAGGGGESELQLQRRRLRDRKKTLQAQLSEVQFSCCILWRLPHERVRPAFDPACSAQQGAACYACVVCYSSVGETSLVAKRQRRRLYRVRSWACLCGHSVTKGEGGQRAEQDVAQCTACSLWGASKGRAEGMH